MFHLYNIYKLYKFIITQIYSYIYLNNNLSILYDSNDSHYVEQCTSLLIKL